MAAFLDADGLNIFYGLIAAKFGSKLDGGAIDYSKVQYSGDGGSTTGTFTIKNLKRSTELDAGQADLAIISGTPKNANGVDSLGIIWGGTGLTGAGLTVYRDADADILTISMVRHVQLYLTRQVVDNAPIAQIRFDALPTGFTPYDPAFTAMQPDYAKAMLRDANTFYTAGFFKFTNSVIDASAT